MLRIIRSSLSCDTSIEWQQCTNSTACRCNINGSVASGSLSSPSPPAVQTAGHGSAETALAAFEFEFHKKKVGIPWNCFPSAQHASTCAGHKRKLAHEGLATAG